MLDRKKIAVSILAALTVCVGGVGLYGCQDTSPGQDDERYKNESFESARASESYDGANVNLPDGYVPAYESVKENNTVVEKKLNDVIEINGVKYTVKTPSKVHRSNTMESFDSFLIDLEVEGSEEHPAGEAAGVSYFIYVPSGLYASDLRDMAKMQELDAKRMEYEEKGEEVPVELYDEYAKLQPEGTSYTKTFETPYDGDGTYTFEIRDFANSTLYRIPFEIKLS